jgi:hypothetical protein
MLSIGTWRRVVLVRTDATQYLVPQDIILHCNRRENIPENSILRSYIILLYGEVNQDIFAEATVHEQVHKQKNKTNSVALSPRANYTDWATATCRRNLVSTEKKQTNSVAFSPQANYTDWATAICWRNLVPTFADRRVSRGQRGGSRTVVNLSFLDRQ